MAARSKTDSKSGRRGSEGKINVIIWGEQDINLSQRLVIMSLFTWCDQEARGRWGSRGQKG